MALYFASIVCLSYIVTIYWEFKFQIYNPPFKVHEKWEKVNANHHQTMDKCDIS